MGLYKNKNRNKNKKNTFNKKQIRTKFSSNTNLLT